MVGVVLGLVLVWFLWFNRREKDRPQYRMARTERGSITAAVTASATVNPLITVQVGSQVSGIVARLFADFNGQVRAGQVIAQLDPTFLQAAVNVSRASLGRAEANLKDAERKLKRAQELAQSGLLAESDLETNETAVASARADRDQAQADLERAETNLRYATIHSPIDGVVISRDVDLGQTVAASLQAPTLFTIAKDLRKMQAEASVDEADIGKITVGQNVSFTVDAFPDRPFSGRVSQIRLAPVTVQNVVTYTVIIQVDNEDLKLRPGMTANVSIIIAHRDNALKVPNSALRFRPTQEAEAVLKQMRSQQREQRGSGATRGGPGNRNQSRGPRVWTIARDGKLAPVALRLGITDGTSTEVVSGDIREGQEIVVGLVPTAGATTQATPLGGVPSAGPMGRRM